MLLQSGYIDGVVNVQVVVFIVNPILKNNGEGKRRRLGHLSNLINTVENEGVKLIKHRLDVLHRLILLFNSNFVPNLQIYVELCLKKVKQRVCLLCLQLRQLPLVVVQAIGVFAVADLVVFEYVAYLLAHVAAQIGVELSAPGLGDHLVEMELLNVDCLALRLPFFRQRNC